MTLHRRQLLQSAGLGLLCAPFLTQMRNAWADDPPGPARRLVLFFSPNGTIHSRWRPTGGETDFSFAPGSILEPLAAIRREVTILDGIDFLNANNHEGGMAAMLTGGGGSSSPTMGASIDQFLAGRIGGMSRFPSLEFGVLTSPWGGNTQTRMSYRQAGQFVHPDDDPASVLQRLFGAMMPSTGTPDAATLRRRSVLDLVRGEVQALRAAAPSEPRQRLDVHLDALRQMEMRLAGTTVTAACSAPAITSVSPSANDDFPRIGRAQTDLMVAALACGMTKVASIQWAHTVAPTVFRWAGLRDEHHNLSHSDNGNTAGVQNFVTAERWYAEQFVYLVNALAALPEPGGTGRMLDHTLVVWCKELGDGRLHDCLSVPWVLAGGASGHLANGRYLRLTHAPHQRLLASICGVMGASVPGFGDLSRATGTLSGVFS